MATRKKRNPIIEAQRRILVILEPLPVAQQLSILRFMAEQVSAAQAIGAQAEPAQAVLGQSNGLFGEGE